MKVSVIIFGGLAWIGSVWAGKDHHGEGGKKHGGDKKGGVAAVMLPGKGGQFVTASPVVGCAQGYRLAGDRCERLEYAPGQLICPKHAELVGEQCLVRERIGAASQCPPGSARTGKGGCEIAETVIPLVDCPKGWDMTPDGTQCMRVHKGKGKSVCPDGFEGKHGNCIRTEMLPARPSCPPGYILQDDGKKHSSCAMIEVAAPEVFCHKGWIADGGACIRIKTKAKAHAQCPAGFQKGHKGTCERLITQETAVTCGPGMVLIPDGGKKGAPICRALEYTSVIPTCKKGYEFINGQCQKHSKGEAHLECEKGLELGPDGRCFGTTEVPAISECPPDTIARGKHCYATEAGPLLEECPKHANLVGGLCISHEIVAPSFMCPEGFKKGKKHEDSCQAEQIVLAEPQCPPDARLSGKKHCLVTRATQADAICKKGELTPQGCVEHTKKAPHTECPKGFKKHKGNCKREVSLPAAYVCPPGAILQEGNQCLATQVSQPAFSCPPHFSLDPQNNCINVRETEPILACPANTVLTNGECFHASFVASEKGKKHKKSH